MDIDAYIPNLFLVWYSDLAQSNLLRSASQPAQL